MSTIPASAIVNVTPNVLAAGGSGLDLNGLVLVTNTRVPIGAVQSFADAIEVADFFGLASAEAVTAGIYFNGFDNSNVKPGAILFAQYPASAVSAYLRGGNISAMTLTQLQALNGTLSVTIDSVLKTASINLSAATSFSNAAEIIGNGLAIEGVQAGTFTASIATSILTVSAVLTGALAVGDVISGTGITANTYITAQLSGTPGGIGTYSVVGTTTAGSTTVTAFTPGVTYDSVTGAFVIVSGTTGATSTITFGSGAMATSLLLTQATGAVLSQGAAAATPAAFMNGLVQVTQDWATFMTSFNPDNSGNANKLAFAAWVNGTNDRYAYICWDTDASPTTTVPATSSLGFLIAQADYSGTCLIYEASDLHLAAFVCGAIASIDFTETDGRTTLAFRSQTGLSASVTSQAVADNLKANGYNFYGAYATANDQFVFFYPGTVSGPFEWLDSYVDQIWLNNAFQLALMELLTQAKSIPYNPAGYAMIETSLADAINAGLNFGAFRAGVTLSASQIAAVNAAAGANVAGTLQNRGWYLQVSDASPSVRQARESPPATFWYCDGQSVQQINLTSVEVK